ncbi:hypothetical protein ACETK8_03955 [Brevundimonas staleyi]|uniref:hypothetical protein n=1 Tax=Brevundimonas staleyi TaxID=74326 RepID=UPI0035A73DBA
MTDLRLSFLQQSKHRCAEAGGRLQLRAEGPEAFQAVAVQAKELLAKLAGKLDVRDAEDRRPIPLNREIYLGADFKDLWDRIKAKTTYRLDFDNDALVADAIKRLSEMPKVAKAQVRFVTREMEITDAGVAGVRERVSGFMSLAAENAAVPDVLGELQNRTQLTRRSLAKMLIDSGRLDDLRANPAVFIDQAADLIDQAKIAALVDGIRYERIASPIIWNQLTSSRTANLSPSASSPRRTAMVCSSC